MLAAKAKIGKPIHSTSARVLVETANQTVDEELPEKMAARVARQISPLGQLLRCQRLCEFPDDSFSSLALQKPMMGLAEGDALIASHG